jgi:YD repeat-containing protein
LIEYFNEKDQLRSSQKFYWEGTELRCKAMFDENHQPLFAKTFVYDAGNVVEEILWGYLTGNETTPLQIEASGRCSGGESYRKTYSYYKDQFNLLKTEYEEDGPTYEYSYKSGTDLCTAKLTKDKKGAILTREFSFYNDDNLIVHEIVDDGSSSEPNDIRGVTQRLEKRYERNNVSGLPESLSESYLDLNTQTLKPLKTIKYTYLNQRVHTEEVFDALGVSRYTITTDYDDFGSIKRKTTPLERENIYRYNHDGSLEESKEVGSSKKIFVYDQANRLKSCEEPDTGKIAITSYDLKGRILTQSDFRENQTIHTYDFFGNRKTTKLPECKNEEGQTCSPILKFDYDIHGNLELAEMPLKEKTLNTYNLFRKPILVTQADGTQIRHFYNRSGTLEKTLYSDGTEVRYGYDLFKRQTSKTIYSGQGKALLSEEWDYGSFQLLSYTDTRGLKTQFTHDGAGRKITEEALGRKVTFTYDSLGFLEKTDNGVIALLQKHNVEGLVEEQWEEEPTGRIENWMKYFYDKENRKEKAGIETPIVCLTRQFMATTGGRVYNINPQLLWLYIPHSEGGVIAKRAIEGMTEGQQQTLQEILHIFSVGSAEPLARYQGASVENVYSNKDRITLRYAKPYMNNPDYDIRILSCQSSIGQCNLWIADHGFLQPTYRAAWSGHIDELKEKFKFYRGSSENTR